MPGVRCYIVSFAHMKVVAIAIWAVLAFYSLLCVWMPEVRPYHKRSEKKFGLFASLGLALFFWFPALVYAGEVTGLIHRESWPLMWVIFSICMFVVIVGSWIEYMSD